LTRRGRESFESVRSQFNDAVETGRKAAQAKREEFETE